MTSSVNNLPPPFANQALAQAREAGRIQAENSAKAPPKVVADGASRTRPPAEVRTRPPAEVKDSSDSTQANFGNGQQTDDRSVSPHVNIEA